MNKYLPFLLIVTVLFVMIVMIYRSVTPNSMNQQQASDRTPQAVDLGVTPTPVSEMNLDTASSVESSIDSEIQWLDNENKISNQIDFSDAGLTDTELGL